MIEKKIHVDGEAIVDIVLYALSTCGWCRKTRKFLGELGVEHTIVEVDQLEGTDKQEARAQVRQWNPRCSYPTLVIDSRECIVGFDETKIRKVLGK